MSSKKGTAYSFSFTPKELFYKLFKRKRCPKCNGKLVEVHEKEFKGIEKNTRSARMHSHYADEHEVYKVDILYKCTDCHCVYTIEELSKSIND